MADATVQPTKTPWHVWVVGAVSLLWNSGGAVDFVMTQTRNSAWMGRLTPAELEYFYGFPIWVVIAWGIATWGGALGSLLLLLRSRLAVHLFLASFICMVLTSIYNYALSNGLKIMGGAGQLIFSAIIIVVGALLLAYARSMCRRGVLR